MILIFVTMGWFYEISNTMHDLLFLFWTYYNTTLQKKRIEIYALDGSCWLSFYIYIYIWEIKERKKKKEKIIYEEKLNETWTMKEKGEERDICNKYWEKCVLFSGILARKIYSKWAMFSFLGSFFFFCFSIVCFDFGKFIFSLVHLALVCDRRDTSNRIGINIVMNDIA